jgi:diguanylate cyclase (GGDEF)-like protein
LASWEQRNLKERSPRLDNKGVEALNDPSGRKRQMTFTAAAMFGGAAFVGLVEGLIPGGPELSLMPALSALGFVIVLVILGPRLPMRVLGALGPIGAGLIAYALATTPPGQGDGALLYIWPVLWVAYFFGRSGSILIVAWIGVVQGAALIYSNGVLDRWIDVMVSVGIVAAVVHALRESNKRLVARLEAEARVDKLTGVLNRRGFEEHAALELERAGREGYSVGAATFDIDYFKRVNDEWGHDTGDRVLGFLGGVLLAQTRAPDIVARLGGEEFVALLTRAEGDDVHAYAERVREAFAAAADLGLPPVTVSAGVTADVAPESIEGLLQVADSALYAAKRAGRDRTVVHRSAALQPAG